MGKNGGKEDEKSISSRSGSGYGSFHDSAVYAEETVIAKEDLKVGIIYIGDETRLQCCSYGRN